MKKIIIFLFAAVITVSCSMEGLDRDPQGGLSPVTFWQNEKDVWSAVNELYASISASEWDIAVENGTDNFTSHHHDWDAAPWVYVSRNQVQTSQEFGYGFAWTRAANYALEKMAEMGEDKIDPVVKERYAAEIRVIRAWNYMQSTMLFGDVPLITKVLSTEEAENISRTPKAEVRQFILNEFTEAAAVLPNNYAGGFGKEVGRITKGASLALKARAALYFGDYVTAEQTAKQVMDMNMYSLHKVDALTPAQQLHLDMLGHYVDFNNLPAGMTKESFGKGIFSYRSIWYGEYAKNSNPEYIFTKQFIPDNKDYFSYMPHWVFPRGVMQGDYGWASFCPTQKLVDAYWMIDGQTKVTPKTYAQRAADFKALKALTGKNDVEGADGSLLYDSGQIDTDAFIQEFNARDARFYASIAFPFSPTPEFTENGKDSNNVYEWDRGFNGRGITGYFLQKLYDPAMEKDPQYNYYGSLSGDFPLFRYAEILLIYAEARTHNTSFDALAQGALNELRDRAGMPNVPTSLSKKDALNFIHNERRIELAGEGQRFYDIRRYEMEDPTFEDAASKVQTGTVYDCNNQNGVVWSWDPKLLLMPIPNAAIDFNSNITQNPGY